MKKPPLKKEDLERYLGAEEAKGYYKYLDKYNRYLDNYNEYTKEYNGYNRFFSFNWKAILLFPFWAGKHDMWNFFVATSLNFFFMVLFLYLPTILGRTLFYAPDYIQYMVQWMPYLFGASLIYRFSVANALLFDRIVEVKENKRTFDSTLETVLFSLIFVFIGYMEFKDYEYKPFDQASHDAFEHALEQIRGKEAKIKILKTGQSKSYAPYDDGATQRGEERNYTNNGDGTVTDNVTGLMWQDTREVRHDFYWDRAMKECSELKLAGYSDWRLPAIDELATLIDLNNSKAPYIGQVFKYREDSSFWSSTVSVSDENWIKTIIFNNTHLYGGTKKSSQKIRCVRTLLKKEESTVRLIRDNNREIILDTYTKFMWQDKPFNEEEKDNIGNRFNYGRSLKWKDALSYCDGLWYGGYHDWFLPNRLEIYSYSDKENIFKYNILKYSSSSTIPNQSKYNSTTYLTSCARKVK